MNKVMKNIGYLILLKFGTYIFPLIVIPYLTNILGTKGYGMYSWGNSVNAIFRMFIDFGFVVFGVQAVADCKGDKKQVGYIMYSIMVVKLLIALTSAFVLVLLSFTVEVFQENKMLIYLFYLTNVISVFNIDYVFQGIEKMQYITIRTLSTKTVFTFLVFLLVKNEDDLLLVPILLALGDFIVTAIMWFQLLYKEKIIPQRSQNGIMKKLICKSNWFFCSRIMGAVYSQGNIVLIGILFSPSLVSQFSLAYNLIGICTNFEASIADGLYPYMVKTKDIKVIRKVMFLFEPVVLVLCIVGYFISPYLIRFIFGEEYNGAIVLFRMMIPIIVVNFPSMLLGFPTLSSFGYYKEVNYAVIIAGIIHVVLIGGLYISHLISLPMFAVVTVFTESIVLLTRSFFVCQNKHNFVHGQ